MAEAIVNVIAHRDYTSNASVQVMLFRDRFEIWNPGHLPLGWTTEKLKQLHTSVPANPLLAEPLYLAGYIERMGTGTSDMVKKSVAAGLAEPQFVQTEDFRSILYRPSPIELLGHVTDHVTDHVKSLVLTLDGNMSRLELMNILGLRHNQTFRENYFHPALKEEWIEMTLPDKPKSINQKYRLTRKGKAFKEQLDRKD